MYTTLEHAIVTYFGDIPSKGASTSLPIWQDWYSMSPHAGIFKL
ncbi:MAG TPA: hypothetical protein PLS51_02335 [Flavobacterium sp.]|nr:hypothetical protein [Flavobacterium sp.]HPJ09439.1 hypothetical protein [Flavobacterium sp.]